MTNVFGEGLDYEIDTDDVLNEVDVKIKMMNILNEKKFVNITGDVIESLQIKNNPVNELDAVNLKYLKLEDDYQTHKKEAKKLFDKQDQDMLREIYVLLKLKSEIKSENEKLKNENEKLKSEIKSENEKLKSENEKLKSEIKSENEKFKSEIKSENEKLKSEIGELKQLIKSEIAEFKQMIKSEIAEFKQVIKSDITEHKQLIKSNYEKYKNEIDISIIGYRNKIIDLNNQLTELEKKFNLLNKNITKWHGTVENRLKNKKAV